MSFKYLPDLRYIPDQYTALNQINAGTLLSRSIPLGLFLEQGDIHSQFTTLLERQQLVRNLLPQAEIVRSVRKDQSSFADYSLEVVEGVYKPGANENITTNGIKDLARQGRAVVYELKRNGVVDNDKTFELALWIATYHRTFDRLILDYDTYDPSGQLNAQIIITMPVIPEDYKTTFKREVLTYFNNIQQGGSNELIQFEIGASASQFSVAQPAQYDTVYSTNNNNGRLSISELTPIGSGHYLRFDAAQAYLRMVAAARADNISWTITDSYRDFDTQVRLAEEKGLYSQGGLAAAPGTSNHGWGLAVDLGGGANRNGTPQNNWLRANAARFGFTTIPREPWHWQYNPSSMV